VLLKKICGEEGEKVDVQKLFGYLGLFSLIALWWLGNTIESKLVNSKLIQLKYSNLK
jgi:hypothetical protein